MQKPKISNAEIIEQLTSEHNRMKVNLFLKKDVYTDFKEYCKQKNVKPNEVLEILMEHFTGSFERPRKK